MWNNAFNKIKSWLLAISTPAAAVAIGTGVFIKKFSFQTLYLCVGDIDFKNIIEITPQNWKK